MALRFIQVGLGNWGSRWLRDLRESNLDLEVVACVDRNSEALQVAQATHNIAPERCFTSLEEALDTVDTDVVLIVTNLPSHVAFALLALERGKHVLMEKPFAQTLAEAWKVVGAAEQQERVFMISQTYRYFPAARAVAELVQGGRLGAVGAVNIDFRRPLSQETRNHHIWQPLLANISVHHFDLMRMVLGREPHQMLCYSWNPVWSKFAEPPCAAATITFDGGAVVNYRGSIVSTGPTTNWAGEWRMECEGGEIAWTCRGDTSSADEVIIRPFGREPYAIELPVFPHTDRAGALQAFVQAVRTGEEPECSGRNNLGTVALMVAAVESAASHRPILVTTNS